MLHTKTFRNKTLSLILHHLDDNKAEHLCSLDIRQKSSLADFMVIASGTSSRHVMSLAHHLETHLKKQHILPLNDCHHCSGNWAVIDLGNIIVHILTSEARESYSLEDLWR